MVPQTHGTHTHTHISGTVVAAADSSWHRLVVHVYAKEREKRSEGIGADLSASAPSMDH